MRTRKLKNVIYLFAAAIYIALAVFLSIHIASAQTPVEASPAGVTQDFHGGIVMPLDLDLFPGELERYENLWSLLRPAQTGDPATAGIAVSSTVPGGMSDEVLRS